MTVPEVDCFPGCVWPARHAEIVELLTVFNNRLHQHRTKWQLFVILNYQLVCEYAAFPLRLINKCISAVPSPPPADLFFSLFSSLFLIIMLTKTTERSV